MSDYKFAAAAVAALAFIAVAVAVGALRDVSEAKVAVAAAPPTKPYWQVALEACTKACGGRMLRSTSGWHGPVCECADAVDGGRP